MPSNPGTSLVMVETQFFFEMLVALLNPASFMTESGKVDRCHMQGHIAEEIAKFIPSLCQWPPFNENPHLFMDESKTGSGSVAMTSGYFRGRPRLCSLTGRISRTGASRKT